MVLLALIPDQGRGGAAHQLLSWRTGVPIAWGLSPWQGGEHGDGCCGGQYLADDVAVYASVL